MISAMRSFVREFVAGALAEVADDAILAQPPVLKSNNTADATRSERVAGRGIVTLVSHRITYIWVSLLCCDIESEGVGMQAQLFSLPLKYQVRARYRL
jgi:hypothetical protein